MINEIDHCQYCYNHYDKCDCCNKCAALKGTCDCVEDGPTIMSPADGYRCLHLSSSSLADAFGITTIAQIDAIVMRTYKRDFWPERLKGICQGTS
jgi:hypothetical protein